MSLGLTYAPTTFQRTLDILLTIVRWRTCLLFSDDVVEFLKFFGPHLQDVDMVPSMLRKVVVSFNLKKKALFYQ